MPEEHGWSEAAVWSLRRAGNGCDALWPDTEVRKDNDGVGRSNLEGKNGWKLSNSSGGSAECWRASVGA